MVEERRKEGVSTGLRRVFFLISRLEKGVSLTTKRRTKGCRDPVVRVEGFVRSVWELESVGCAMGFGGGESTVGCARV